MQHSSRFIEIIETGLPCVHSCYSTASEGVAFNISPSSNSKPWSYVTRIIID